MTSQEITKTSSSNGKLMLKQITEKIAQWESKKFAPHKDANLERYNQFVDAMNVIHISDSGLRQDIVDWCASNAKTQERRSRYVNNGLVTTHGLGNNVSYLQICESDSRKIKELWYVDHQSGKAMEIMSALRQFDVPVFAGVTAEDPMGKLLGNKYDDSTYVHTYDRGKTSVHLPGDRFDNRDLLDETPLAMVAIMTMAPVHEIAHGITYVDEKIIRATMLHDLVRRVNSSTNEVRHHKGASVERLAMIGALQVAQKAIMGGVNLWRGYEAKDVIKAINRYLHW